jgi:hypothetical protein
MFTKQKLGLTVRDLLAESRVGKRYQVTLTYKTSTVSASNTAFTVVDEQEFIACMESFDFPLYICTYEP